MKGNFLPSDHFKSQIDNSEVLFVAYIYLPYISKEMDILWSLETEVVEVVEVVVMLVLEVVVVVMVDVVMVVVMVEVEVMVVVLTGGPRKSFKRHLFC